ncbi:hypothetical protein, partial [Pseudomonas aeruginosa]|uniref:hypothetical protein n=1 Tax=Pseudomonas aeruginosa TaxID=287 RepID=UPI001E35ACF2
GQHLTEMVGCCTQFLRPPGFGYLSRVFHTAHLSLSAKNHQCKKILEKGSFFRDLKREYLPEKMQNEYDKYSTEFNRLESECEQSMK